MHQGHCMANDLKLTADFKAFDEFVKFTERRARGIIFAAMRQTLTNQAFIARKFAQKQIIPRMMNTRGNFNQNRVQVTKAKKPNLFAVVGNKTKVGTKGGEYNGLTNLELGKSESNPTIPHLKEVRGGSKRKNVIPSKRMKKVKSKFRRIHKASDLRNLSNSGFDGYFQMKGGRPTELWPGIYRFKGKGRKSELGRTRRIEYIRDTVHPRTKPKLMKWLGLSTKKVSPGITKREWQRVLDRELKKTKKLFK